MPNPIRLSPSFLVAGGAFFGGLLAAAVAGCGTPAVVTEDMGPADMARPGASTDFYPEAFDAAPIPAATMAVLGTSSFMMGGKGSLDTIALVGHAVNGGAGSAIDTSLDEDNVVRAAEGKVFVLDQTHGSLTIYDPKATPIAFANPVQIVTGPAGPGATGDGGVGGPAHDNSNPHDVLPVPASSKIYVALYGNDADHAVGVIDQTHPELGVGKWIAIPGNGKTPLVRANDLWLCGPYIYVTLEDLDDSYTITGPGRIATIDPATDAVLVPDPSQMGNPAIIPLTGNNPTGVTMLDPIGGGCDQVLVAMSGDYSKAIPNGGGVEQVDLTRRKSLGLVVKDSDLGGDAATVSSAGKDLAYVTLNLPDFSNKVVAIDPTAMKVSGDVFGPAGYVAFAKVSPDNQLFVGVARGLGATGQPAPGVYIGPADGKALTAAAIDLGQAPYSLSFY